MTVDKKLVKDNLYQAVNGEWLENAVIPNDKPSTGGFITIRDSIEELLMKDTADMAAGTIALTNEEQAEFVKYYKQAMDFDARNHVAHAPLQPYLDSVDALENYSDLQALAKEWVLKNFTLPFGLGISADMKNTDKYALYANVPGTILPDTTYYEEGNETGRVLLQVYQTMSQQVLMLMGVEEVQAADLAAKAIEFDSLIVPHVLSAEESADYTIMYNPRSLGEVEAYLDNFSFKQLFNELIGEEVDQVIVMQPKYFEALGSILTDENFELMKAWMLVMLANNSTGLFSEELRQIGSQYQLAISGSPETQSAEKHAYNLAIGVYDQVIGDYYGKKYFGPTAREDVREMVVTMIGIFKERLTDNNWLTQDTIDKAIVKLDAIDLLIGYPDDYPEIYKDLVVDEAMTFFGNTIKMTEIRVADEFSKWNEDVDRKRWGMSADTVNAYYNPSANVICFPAAILQAPFYDLEQSRSENYGGIGAVIAHEISHAFDNNGAQFDEKGNMENWWTEQDMQVFKDKAEEMVALWDGIEIHGGKVNGRLTVSENIADAGGLTAAMEAAKLEDDTDLESLFYNWARIWCQKGRDQYLQLLLAIDVHSPNPLRANMPVRSIDEFYEVFDVQPEDGMYLEPEKRVVIW